MTQTHLSPIVDLFERLGLVIGTGRPVAIEFSVGTLVARDRKVSFEFRRELHEASTKVAALISSVAPVASVAPIASLIEINDSVELPVAQLASRSVGASSLSSKLLPVTPKTGVISSFLLGQPADRVEDVARSMDNEVVHEVNWDEVKEVAGFDHSEKSQEVPMLFLPRDRVRTEKILRRRLSPSSREAYHRLLHDMKQRIMREPKYVNVRGSI